MDKPTLIAKTTSNVITRCALQHYESLPSKGKPQSHEWTVYAAIVAKISGISEPWVVSSATGSKCTAIQEKKEWVGMVLHDSHAEVLARRGLQRVLWNEIVSQRGITTNSVDVEDNTRRLLDKGDNNFALRRSLEFHMYISDSPCGDASIYKLSQDCDINYSGAKVILSQKTGVEAEDCGGNHQLINLGSATAENNQPPATRLAREDVQITGALRTKSGRSNLADHLRSTSMSCSDKLVRWSIVGIQGALLSKFIPEPIRFASVCVSRDPRASTRAQKLALERAIPSRVAAALEAGEQNLKESCVFPREPVSECFAHAARFETFVDVVEETYKQGKSYVEARNAVASTKNVSDSVPSDSFDHEPWRKRKMEPQGPGTSSKRKKKLYSPCGVCFNWQQSLDPFARGSSGSSLIEVTVGARGIKQGKKPKSLSDYRLCASRLSRWEMAQLALVACNNEGFSSYADMKMKSSSEKFNGVRNIVLEGDSGPLVGWLCNAELGDFTLPKNKPEDPRLSDDQE